MRWIDRATLVLLGYGLASLTYGAGYRQFIYLIRGLSIQLGLSFVGSAIEQYRDIESVRQFFLTSGYAVWMMHLTLGIELVLGAWLLVPAHAYKKMPAVALLLAVMMGSVTTHFQRGDPINYAMAAIELALKSMILLSLLFIRVSHPRYEGI